MTKKDFPLIVHATDEMADLYEWLINEKDGLEKKLAKHGAILYRGFKCIDAQTLNRLVQALSKGKFSHSEESSPRSRIIGSIYTSTNYRADHDIFPHNENSYKNEFPMKLFFYCDQPSEQGGETPIVDCRAVLQRLEPNVKQKFMEKKWMYVRNFGAGVGISWEEAFNTTDRAVVERYCHSEDIQFEWIGEDSLRTKQVRDPILKHPLSAEPSWFNHIAFFNVMMHEPEVRETLLSIYEQEELPHNTYYGDGSVIEPEVIDALRCAYIEETVDFKWQKGDLIIIDNLLSAHSRRPYQGERRILFAQTDPTARTPLVMESLI